MRLLALAARHRVRKLAAVPDSDAPASTPTPPTTAAFFDLDKTIISKSSTLVFGRSFYHGGLIGRRAVLRSSYAQFVFLLGGADHDQMERMRSYLSQLCSGWEVAQVRDIVNEAIDDLIQPLIFQEAAELIAAHHAAGREVVVVSSSGEEIVEPIGRMIGADTVIATRMEEADGRFTGQVQFYAYGANKAVAVREHAAKRGYDLAQCYAYSDSITDLPMLEEVGHPTAVNPDRALRRIAAERGWQVATFAHPVRAKEGSTFGRLPAGKALAALLGVGLSATAWIAGRRWSGWRR